MTKFLENIFSGLIANFLFAIFIIVLGWLTYYFTERRKLLNFFNIQDTKRLVVYISKLRVMTGGSKGTDNNPRAYNGAAVVYNEQLIANKYKEKFNYLVPSLSESPSFLSKILFTDIKVMILPSPIDESEIVSNCSIISFGSPGYNKVSDVIQKTLNSVLKFSDDNLSITITGVPDITDTRQGFIQRLISDVDGRKKSTFCNRYFRNWNGWCC